MIRYKEFSLSAKRIRVDKITLHKINYVNGVTSYFLTPFKVKPTADKLFECV